MPKQGDSQFWSAQELKRVVSLKHSSDVETTLTPNETVKTIDDARSDTALRVETLGNARTANSEKFFKGEFLHANELISDCFKVWDPKWMPVIVDVLCENSYPEIVTQLLERLIARGFVADDETELFSRKLYAALLNFTLKSDLFRQKLSEAGLVGILVRYLKGESIGKEALNNSKKQDFLKQSLAICHNLARNPEIIQFLVENNVHEALAKYLDYDGDMYVPCLACLCIAQISRGNAWSDKNTNLIDKLVEFTVAALKDSNHSFRGIFAEELAEGLALLAIKQSVNARLLENRSNFLTYILHQLIASNDEEEQDRGIGLIQQLCFAKGGSDFFKQHPDECLRPLETITKKGTANRQRKDDALRLLAFIKATPEEIRAQQEIPPIPEGSPSTSKKTDHVFFSYNHHHQALVRNIHDRLYARGVTNTWIDYKDMGNHLYTEMHQAILRASVVLIFFSESYYQSGNCRIEGQLSRLHKGNRIIAVRVQDRYQAADWLEAVIVGLIWIDMPDNPLHTVQDEKIAKLAKEINSIQGTPEQLSTKPRPSQSSTTFDCSIL